jgi:hypothetical protein
MYDPIKNAGVGTFIPNQPKDQVVAFPFTVPTAPTGFAVSYYAQVGHDVRQWMSAHFSAVAKDLGTINPNKTGNPESILCQGQNVHPDKPGYVAPGTQAFFNAAVAANNKVPLGPTATFAFQSTVFPLKA